MPLTGENWYLAEFCNGPAGICAAVGSCDNCNSINKEKAGINFLLLVFAFLNLR